MAKKRANGVAVPPPQEAVKVENVNGFNSTPSALSDIPVGGRFCLPARPKTILYKAGLHTIRENLTHKDVMGIKENAPVLRVI